MIVTYNKEQVGDVLMLTLKNSGDAKLAVERKGKVARVYREDKQETVAWNIFDASSFFAIEGKASQNVWSTIGNQNLWWEKSLKWWPIQIVTT